MNFQNYFNFLNIQKNNKFGIVGKLRPSGILKWKIFRKKEELTLKKMNMKILPQLAKIYHKTFIPF